MFGGGYLGESIGSKTANAPSAAMAVGRPQNGGRCKYLPIARIGVTTKEILREGDFPFSIIPNPYTTVRHYCCNAIPNKTRDRRRSCCGPSHAISVRIVSAFFSPGSDMLKRLNAAKNLRLVISEEFTVNNPQKIETLKTALIRSVPIDSDQGKLHAKVFLAEMPDGSDWALLGSANLTDQGLFFNQEACIALSSVDTADQSTIAEIKEWFRAVWDAFAVD
jgi:phosphatidylserine/phosphatidylglycerophosphate/cardiolipin synthase-like enzyme